VPTVAIGAALPQHGLDRSPVTQVLLQTPLLPLASGDVGLVAARGSIRDRLTFRFGFVLFFFENEVKASLQLESHAERHVRSQSQIPRGRHRKNERVHLVLAQCLRVKREGRQTLHPT
jgi:hypothetical protein